jgi:Uma2 family endonuclease
MSAPPATVQDRTTQVVAEQRVILSPVSWATYESLLADLANQSSIRLTYDQGTLEIMSPLPEHEESNRTLALLVEVLAEELDLDIRNLGSTTFRRATLARGFEPDSCFYMQHEVDISGKTTIDLSVDPPPDLIIEIDITHPSLARFPLYAQLGVPEIWRYDGQQVQISLLTSSGYVNAESSQALPLLTRAVLTDFLIQSKTLKRTAWLRALRAWIRQAS